jgi:hypothetical protein
MTDEASSIFGDDFSIRKSSRYYIVLIILFITYVVLCCWGIIRHPGIAIRSMSRQNWLIFSVFTAIPLVGLFLFVRKRKIGWAYCLCYYLFAGLAYIVVQIKELIRTMRLDYRNILSWQAYTLCFLSIGSIILLLSKEVRTYLAISLSWLRVSLIIAILVASSFAALMAVYG